VELLCSPGGKITAAEVQHTTPSLCCALPAGAIYHLKYKPPPPEVVDRLVQRSDDTEEKVSTHYFTT
jgi:hypothetical protein